MILCHFIIQSEYGSVPLRHISLLFSYIHLWNVPDTFHRITQVLRFHVLQSCYCHFHRTFPSMFPEVRSFRMLSENLLLSCFLLVSHMPQDVPDVLPLQWLLLCLLPLQKFFPYFLHILICRAYILYSLHL